MTVVCQALGPHRLANHGRFFMFLFCGTEKVHAHSMRPDKKEHEKTILLKMKVVQCAIVISSSS
jgi:hypothetical protein